MDEELEVYAETTYGIDSHGTFAILMAYLSDYYDDYYDRQSAFWSRICQLERSIRSVC